MRPLLFFMIAISAMTLLCTAFAAEPQGVDLAALQGWDIVVAEDARPSESYAAKEFQSHLGQATGLELPIVTESDRPNLHIFIGASEPMKASPVGFDTSTFGPEDLRIVIRDDNIVIAGGRPRGTLYGVYVFLEDYLGVRFLTADHTHVPKIASPHVVGPLDRFYHPPLSFRWSYYEENSGNPAFGVRLRNNTITDETKLGGKTQVELINHSFGYLIPSSKYGKEHPEYFAEIEGKRLSDVSNDWYETEPCLTNPEVLRIVTEEVLKILAEHPEKANISVSQNDNDKYCRCARSLSE